MKNNVTEKIVETLQNNLGRLSWHCRHCPKILECEEQAAATRDFEPRYCWTIIKAALNDEINFVKPFER